MNLHEFKTELANHEKSLSWDKVLELLRSQWDDNKEDGIISAIIIEEMFWAITSIEDWDFGRDTPVFHGIWEYRKQCQELINKVASYSMKHCQNDPYYLWRVGKILMQEPHMLYGTAGIDIMSAEKIGLKMRLHAVEIEPENILYNISAQSATLQFKGIGFLSQEEKTSIRNKLDTMHLQDNIVDQEILFDFEAALK